MTAEPRRVIRNTLAIALFAVAYLLLGFARAATPTTS